MRTRCRGNVFTKQLPRNGSGIFAYLAVVAYIVSKRHEALHRIYVTNHKRTKLTAFFILSYYRFNWDVYEEPSTTLNQ
jgi:hypothetical protein